MTEAVGEGHTGCCIVGGGPAGMVLGLLLIQRQAEIEQVRAAAEVDAQLLADDLPPDAYSDPGFAEFLRRPAP